MKQINTPGQNDTSCGVAPHACQFCASETQIWIHKNTSPELKPLILEILKLFLIPVRRKKEQSY